MKPTARLRELLGQPDIITAPGAYDGITARLIEQAGFPAVYMTGAGTSMARGFPDFGLLSMSEMAENAAVLARTVEIPVIADADTGYGNELNVTRTVREFEARGVAGIHIEDQASPKRCGHLDGKEIIPQAEFISKIRAAVAARRDPGFSDHCAHRLAGRRRFRRGYRPRQCRSGGRCRHGICGGSANCGRTRDGPATCQRTMSPQYRAGREDSAHHPAGGAGAGLPPRDYAGPSLERGDGGC